MSDNVKARANIIFREEGEEGFLFNPEREEVKILNEVGMFIWKLCDGKYSVGEVVEKIIEEFDIESQEAVKADVENFLRDLKELNLIYAE